MMGKRTSEIIFRLDKYKTAITFTNFYHFVDSKNVEKYPTEKRTNTSISHPLVESRSNICVYSVQLSNFILGQNDENTRCNSNPEFFQ